MKNLKVNDVLHATLKDANIFHGRVDKITKSGFWIDDDLSGKILILDFSDVETVYGIY